jgi:hypothetical protein
VVPEKRDVRGAGRAKTKRKTGVGWPEEMCVCEPAEDMQGLRWWKCGRSVLANRARREAQGRKKRERASDAAEDLKSTIRIGAAVR